MKVTLGSSGTLLPDLYCTENSSPLANPCLQPDRVQKQAEKIIKTPFYMQIGGRYFKNAVPTGNTKVQAQCTYMYL